MSNISDNKYWPNAGGTLGNNKVAIPDGVTTPWPEGDALVDNFVYKEGKLNGFIDTKALILNDSATTTINYDFVDVTFDSIGEGTLTINRGPRSKYFNVRYGVAVEGDGGSDSGNTGDTIVLGTKYLGCKTIDDIKAIDPNYLTTDIVDGVWNESLKDLTSSGGDGSCSSCSGGSMFNHCTNLITFNSDLSSLQNGADMFLQCGNLETFNAELPKLIYGTNMFSYCANLTLFKCSNLSSLTTGETMFNCCSNLTTFDADLSSLTDGRSMFWSCTNLTTFDADLSSLTNSYQMFSNCTNLTTFTSDLSSLTDGERMFLGCKLDTASVQQIARTINPYNGRIDIGIGNTKPNDEETAAFNNMAGKGWTVYVNGSSWSSSPHPYVLVDETTTETPIPFYAKPIEVEENKAKYVGEDGKFYNILGAQFIYGDNLSTYGMFINEEDAAANMRLTKIVQEEIETA